jgi:hypothetical protein
VVGNPVAGALIGKTIDLFKGARLQTHEQRHSAARLVAIAAQTAAHVSATSAIRRARRAAT